MKKRYDFLKFSPSRLHKGSKNNNGKLISYK